MLFRLCFKFKNDSEELRKKKAYHCLPKAIRSCISQSFYYSLVSNAYLFHGVSDDLLFHLVSEMKPEYFSSKEDVILQNETSKDFYLVVKGAVELLVFKNGTKQVVGKARTGDFCGEIGVLCHKPQFFTVRTKKSCRLLRMNWTLLLNIVQAHVGYGAIILNNLLQHLKNTRDPKMQVLFMEPENKLDCGRMDLPLTLNYATIGGHDHLFYQLLRRGLDPNESDNSGRTPLHIAAAKGSGHCVRLLLDHGADPNSRDSNGNVPLWEAIVGKHEREIKMLIESGGDLLSGDMGQFVCTAVEQNNLYLLKKIVEYGGDVKATSPQGTTALHTAVCEGNFNIVKFLLEQGADVDKRDRFGWSPRMLAAQQAHEEIEMLFQSKRITKHQSAVSVGPGFRYLTKHQSALPYFDRNQSAISVGPGFRSLTSYRSEPSILSNSSRSASMEVLWGGSIHRRKASSFHNSLFGIMSAAQEESIYPARVTTAKVTISCPGIYPARVTISCPEAGETGKITGKLVLLPKSLEELIGIGATKFGILASKVLTKDRAEVDDIELIRDGDHLILASDNCIHKSVILNLGN